MKRSEQTIFDQTIYGVRIHLDELENIVQLIESWGFGFSLKDDTYQYDSLDELASENPNGLNHLTISVLDQKGRSEFIYIYFRKNATGLYGLTPNPEGRALLLEIKKLLGRGSRFRIFFLPTLLMLCGAIPIGLVSLFSRMSTSPLDDKYYSIAFGIWVIFALATIYVYAYGYFGKVIVTKHRRKDQGFLERNWDNIILVVVSSIITLLITWVFSLF